MSKAGRIALNPTLPESPELDETKVNDAMVAMREQAVDLRELEDTQLAFAAQAVGGALMARLHKSFSHAAEVNMFNQVRDLPLAVLRRVPLPKIADTSANLGGAPEGGAEKIADTSANLEDFCRRVFGRSATTMREEAQNLHILGEQAYETAAQLHISKSALRLTRALPPEKLEVVRTAIGNGSTKAEVLAVIEDLAEKVKSTEEQLENERRERDADRQVSAKKSERIDALERKMVNIERQTPDEQLVALKKEATAIAADAEGAILGGLRQALIAMNNHGAERGLHEVFMAGLVGQVQAQLNALRAEFNLPDVSTAADAALASEVAQWAQ